MTTHSPHTSAGSSADPTTDRTRSDLRFVPTARPWTTDRFRHEMNEPRLDDDETRPSQRAVAQETP